MVKGIVAGIFRGKILSFAMYVGSSRKKGRKDNDIDQIRR